MKTSNTARGDTGKRFSEQVKREVALAISSGKITLAEARKLHDIKGGNTLKGWINKYAGGRYTPGKRGRKSASEKNGFQFLEGAVSMIPAAAVSNNELRQVLLKREAELESELRRIRHFQTLILKSSPKSSTRKQGSLPLAKTPIVKNFIEKSSKKTPSRMISKRTTRKSSTKKVTRQPRA
mgnify:CR=1 FL=1